MTAEDFFNNSDYEPKDIVDWGEEGVFYSLEDVEAYAKEMCYQKQTTIQEQSMRLTEMIKENTELRERIENETGT